SSSETRIEVTALRRALLAAYVLGLGFSISLSEASLTALVALWLWRLLDAEHRAAATWPLAGPLLLFAGATALSALASGHFGRGVTGAKEVLLALALYAVADAVSSVDEADRFLSGLMVVAAAAALMGVFQVSLCPAAEPASGVARWFFHRCA